MLRAAAVAEVRTEAARAAARETAVVPRVAIVKVRVITTRRVLGVSATVIERGIVIVIETETETGKETLAAVFALGSATASVTKSGAVNVSVAATPILLACISRRIMAAMDTVQTRMSEAIRTACTRARTMGAGARVTIRAAHTFTSMAPAGFYPSSAVRLRTSRPIPLGFGAGTKRGSRPTKRNFTVGAF